MQPPQIGYAPALPGQKRRRLIRRVAFGTVALGLIVLAIKSAPSAWHRAQIHFWQHQAMYYAAPADRVVYDDDPNAAAKLLSANHALASGSRGEAFEYVPAWDRFYQLVSPPGRRAAATLFLHERRNSNGERRLVVVEEWYTHYFGSNSGTAPVQNGLQCLVFKPGTIYNDPKEVLTIFKYDGPLHLDPGPKVRWFAGQPDATNPSHFTIRGVIDGKPTTVDGWLRDDSVDLSLSP